MIIENVACIDQLIETYQSDPSALESLSEEELHVLINFLIENSKTDSEDEILERCIDLLDQFGGYSDDFESEKLLFKIISTMNQYATRKKLRTLKRLTIAAALLVISAICIYPSVVNSRQCNLKFNFEEGHYTPTFNHTIEDDQKKIYSDPPAEIFYSKTTYHDLGKFIRDYPDVLFPAYVPDGFTFNYARITSSDGTSAIYIQYHSEDDTIIEYKVTPTDSVIPTVCVEPDSGSSSSATVNGITYRSAVYDSIPAVIFNIEDNTYVLNSPDSVPSLDTLEKIARSFQ